ncbi:hypothetical protein ACHAW5_009916 [Stephanodiscus triporus]|uniref:Ribosome silencing factor n=1 Tax=Stephanodiscus triporus TaxID=2934178 RepID=A0ABD3QN41_9STRA
MPHRGIHHLMLTTCCCYLVLATTSRAFQATSLPPSQSSRATKTTTTPLRMSSRKGNRGSQKQVSTNTSKRTRPQVNDVLSSITSPPEFPYSVDPSDLPPGPVSSDPLVPLVHTIVKAADMRKASDIVAMRVTSCTSLTNFVVIISGTSRPQNQAIANAVSRDVEDSHDGRRCLGNGIPEGSADSGWILLDYGEVMVHVMTPKSRLFYDMDGVWRVRGGEYLDLSDVLVVEDRDKMTSNLVNVSDDYDDNDDDEEEEDYDGDSEEEVGYDNGASTSMRERLNVEREIDPFWS